MWQAHGEDAFIHHRTYDINGTQLSAEKRVHAGAGATYSNIFRLPGSSVVLDFHRGVGWNPNYVISSDQGSTFCYGGRLIQWARPGPDDDPKHTGLDGGRPYIVYCQAGGRIHFAIVEDHPRAYDNSVYHGYIEDGGVFDSFGVRLGSLPKGDALPAYSYPALTKVFDGCADAVAWVSDIAAAADGTVTIVFTVQRGGGAARTKSGAGGHDLRYHYARFDGHQWTEFELACGGSCLYPGEDDYSGLISVNPNNPLQIAFSSNRCPVNNLTLRSSADGKQHYQIFFGEVDVAARSARLSALTPDAQEDQIRPVFTRPSVGGHNALFWMAGAYRSYRDFRTRVVGFALTQQTLAWCVSTSYQPVNDEVPERPFMPPDETAALQQYLDGCEIYLEYGCGGSTILAGELGVRSVYSVDSDQQWAGAVRTAFDRRFGKTGQRLRVAEVDIGPIRRWGRPADLAHANTWPRYAVAPWQLLAENGESPTVVLIDGRFRVACFLLSLIAARPGTVILFDDYEREYYHVVEKHCPRAATHGRLAVFRVEESRDIQAILLELIPFLTVSL